MRCEGWRRYGGAFTFGSVTWKQCENDAIVNLTVIQERKKETLPACLDCWNECIEKKIKIVKVVPIEKEIVKEK